MSDINVAIIGGGFVGLTLALQLQAKAKAENWKITLIEERTLQKEYYDNPDYRSSALSYGTQRHYDNLGIWSSISSRCQAIKNIYISDRKRFPTMNISAAEEAVPALGYVVENSWLGSCLWKNLDLSIIDCLCPAKVLNMQPLEKGYRITLNNSKVLNCELAVLADGGSSNLREKLGIHITRDTCQQTALIANVIPSQDPKGSAFEHFIDGGSMALLPLLGNISCALIWINQKEKIKNLIQMKDLSFLKSLEENFGKALGEFKEVGKRHQYPLNIFQIEEQVRPHLVILGNAAHSIHPIAGQGFNLSMRDAKCLADILIASNNVPGNFSDLLKYSESRKIDQKITIGFSNQVNNIFSSESSYLKIGRRLALLGFNFLPSIRHAFAYKAMGLTS